MSFAATQMGLAIRNLSKITQEDKYQMVPLVFGI